MGLHQTALVEYLLAQEKMKYKPKKFRVYRSIDKKGFTTCTIRLKKKEIYSIKLKPKVIRIMPNVLNDEIKRGIITAIKDHFIPEDKRLHYHICANQDHHLILECLNPNCSSEENPLCDKCYENVGRNGDVFHADNDRDGVMRKVSEEMDQDEMPDQSSPVCKNLRRSDGLSMEVRGWN